MLSRPEAMRRTHATLNKLMSELRGSFMDIGKDHFIVAVQDGSPRVVLKALLTHVARLLWRVMNMKVLEFVVDFYAASGDSKLGELIKLNPMLAEVCTIFDVSGDGSKSVVEQFMQCRTHYAYSILRECGEIYEHLKKEAPEIASKPAIV